MLLLNDGGPGAPALGAPPRVHAALKETAGRFDIVGLDQRFAGRSTPLDCGRPVGGLFSAGNGRASFERQVALHRGLAAGCRTTAGAWLPYASTREEVVEVRRDAQVLILSATGDPRTPHRGGAALHRSLPSSPLLTLRGADRHRLYGTYGNACVDDTVNAYLAHGRLSRTDPVCTRQ
ncbi:alpha/beta hydrolase [Kitasatospora sp. CB02891]|uniref:alpha/beta hydrolase n=1 Tax=Kitasatospora sp. CB02891 TaxID=2020329 RepID=UPI001E5FD582|nr:alpha/beta hydrolase [Kitasatospora sp. CB02891]